ncbi:hypothetical protein [Saccharopolyspora shandongensis]|uniref:hypothetical protein n=1 Tax=Saccharopolyspora shandongensis TaxID=418495 RepID=UPI003401EF0F
MVTALLMLTLVELLFLSTRDPQPTWTLIGVAVLGLTGSAFSWWFGMRLRRRSLERREEWKSRLEPPTMQGRIETLRANLQASNRLIEEINAELTLRATALERIRAEAEENQRLASLHEAEADAVRGLVSATIRSAQDESSTQSKRQQWWFFLAGLFCSVPLGIGVNFLYDSVK